MPPAPRTPTILVVDDDATVRRVLQLTFEHAGFRVLVAEQGVQALKVLDDEPLPVSLMLTDVVMPEMDGVALVERVMARGTVPHVIFMSGFIHDPEKVRRVFGRAMPFVQKPFDVDELVERVRRELGAI